MQNKSEAVSLDLPIDYDDSFAYQAEPVHFAHEVHGWQPKGSDAASAIKARRAAGAFTGYGSTFVHPETLVHAQV